MCANFFPKIANLVRISICVIFLLKPVFRKITPIDHSDKKINEY